MIGTRFGYFKRNLKNQRLEAQINWLEKNVPVFLRVEDVYDEQEFGFAFGKLATLLDRQEGEDFKFRKLASEKLTPLANEWRDITVEPEKISEKTFASRISVSSIRLDYSGRIAVNFHDDGMFSGYQIMAYGNIEYGIQVVNMELNN